MVADGSVGGNVGLDVGTALSWINMLHGDSPGLIHICSNVDWSGRTFNLEDTLCDDSIRSYLEQLHPRAHSIYLRTTTLNRPLNPGERGGMELTAALPALWADVDIAGPGHKHIPNAPHLDGYNPDKPIKLPLPGSVQEAQAIITSGAGLPEPTAWIHSGGGIYPWWFIRPPYQPTPATLDPLQELSTHWQRAIAAGAESMGLHYGSQVGDLARVMRLPGTVNRKVESDPRPCTFMEGGSGRQWTIGELDLILSEVESRLKIFNTPPSRSEPKTVPPDRGSSGETPGDHYNRVAAWPEILEPAGWTFSHQRGQTTYWCRPGKNRRDGHSASTGYAGSQHEDRLFVFSDATDFTPNEPYNKFAAYALLNHGGDYASAAAQLRRDGYGAPRPAAPRAPVDPLMTPEQVSRVLPAPTAPAAPVPPAPMPQMSESSPYEFPGVPETRSPNGAPWIPVPNSPEGTLNIQAAINRGILGQGREGGAFVMDGQLVKIATVSGAQPNEPPVRIMPYTATALGLDLARAACTFKWEKPTARNEGQELKPIWTNPTVETLKQVVSGTHWPGVRTLRRIATSPVVRPDGSLLQERGYDAATGIFYAPTEDMVPIPARPSVQEVAAARSELMDRVFADFPWAEDADRANFFGLLVTPLLREFLGDAVTPFGLITASTPGSGKSNLAEAIGHLYGYSMQPMQSSDVELKKTISSTLNDSQAPVVIFDNVRTGFTIRSAELAGLLTQASWQDRLLGTSTMIRARNNRLWLATGNNLRLGGDMVPRTVRVRLEPKMENPEAIPSERFRLGCQFSDWIKVPENRASLLRNLLVLVADWTAAGATRISRPMRSYTQWASGVAGFLAHHGIAGFLDNAHHLLESNPEDEEAVAFLEQWEQRVGPDKQMSATDLVSNYRAGLFVDHRGEVDAWDGTFPAAWDGKALNRRQLPQYLDGLEGRVFAGLKLEALHPRRGRTVYRVVRVEDSRI